MNAIIEELEIEKIDTGIIGAEDKDCIMISKRALDKINEIRRENSIPEEYSLRLGAQSGGCSGMNYILGFDADISDFDKVIDVNDLSVVIDRNSLFYLMGVTLDYVNDEYGSGFIFNNPNNVKTCGCGGGGH
jgi:iron-sulfur cluster assembly protein